VGTDVGRRSHTTRVGVWLAPHTRHRLAPSEARHSVQRSVVVREASLQAYEDRKKICLHEGLTGITLPGKAGPRIAPIPESKPGR
jgi:hypothetical protein